MPEQTKTFHERLIAFQSAVGAVKKEKDNPYFKSKYADINIYLAEIKPKLSEVGLMLTQPIYITEGQMLFMDTIISDGVNEIKTTMQIPQLSDLQKLGAAITYIRRYSLQSLLALEAEDEDANKTKGENILFTEAHKKKIAKINSIEELKTFYEKNKGLGKEFTKAITARKAEILASGAGDDGVEETTSEANDSE